MKASKVPNNNGLADMMTENEVTIDVNIVDTEIGSPRTNGTLAILMKCSIPFNCIQFSASFRTQP